MAPFFWKGLVWGRILTQFGVSLLFGIAAYSKFVEPFAFAQQIMAYALPLPYALVDILVWGIPLVEIGIAIFLVLGLYPRLTASIAGLLLMGFTLLVFSAMWRGLEINCGCFGTPQMVGWPKALENFVLIVLTLLIARWPGYSLRKATHG